jgi:hypothetical protein
MSRLGASTSGEILAKPRILLWDIETSLQLAAIFQLAHNDWIDPSALVTERYVICASWKWLGESTVHSVSVLDDPKRYQKDPHDDTHVVKALHKVLGQADVLVHHNGDSFDKRYVDTRILKLGMAPLAPVTTVDTYKVAKQRFLFNSNKLDYIGKFLGLGEKIKTTPGLWMRVLRGERAAVKDMVVYNQQDVVLLEKVLLKLQPYCPNYINRELFGEQVGCPRCGSQAVQSRGVHRAITKTYQRFCCSACGGWFRTLRAEKGSTAFRVL